MSEDLDPTEFVQRIRQLGEQRDQQDEERVKKLEEEIIQGRSERLARRAERARTLSPDKPSTPQTPRSSAGTPHKVQEKAASTPTPVMDPPQQSRESAHQESLDRLTGSPAQTLEDFEPKKPAPSPAALTRSNTILNWQQRRPQSGARRPLSMAAPSPAMSVSDSPREAPEPSSPAAPALSRDQIAKSLGGKDPEWFRQTAERGIGSAALRRNQEDNLSEAGSVSGRRQLPGLSRETSAEPETTSPPPQNGRPSSPSRLGSVRGSTAWNSRFATNDMVPSGDAEAARSGRAPMPLLESIKFEAPSERPRSVGGSVGGEDQTSSARTLAMSPTQGRISPERVDRSPSPTKGMGGFVQSAMLKRSDSVSKRWSTQNVPTLNRQNSTASSRAGIISGFNSSLNTAKPERPTSLSRETSMEPSSRPSSSSGNRPITQGNDGFVKPALPYHTRTRSTTSVTSAGRPDLEDTPSSPSKRWSPTKKSTWLESALSKPESPKIRPSMPVQQPSWMAEINRIKQQRGSVDLGRGSPLMSSPIDTPGSGRASKEPDAQPSVGTQPSFLEKRDLKDSKTPVMRQPTIAEKEESKNLIVTSQPSIIDKEVAKEVAKSPLGVQPALKPKPVIPPKEEDQTPESAVRKDMEEQTQSPPSSVAPTPAAGTKPKPNTPPKKDFRATLRSRQSKEEDLKKTEEKPDFQQIFGKLKKAQTEKYVAPDELKGNILRGKAALNTTGGPKPSNRKDEFRQSLISQKTAMLTKAQETGSAAHKRADSSSQQVTPEAIVLRERMSRTGSISGVAPAPAPPKEKEGFTPEAIARRKSLRAATRPISIVKSPEAEQAPPNEPVKASKLAERFNPALASVLARGPSPMSSNSAKPVTSPGVSDNASGTGSNGPELTHMTKGRARGPKRRAPGAKQAAQSEEAEQSEPATVKQAHNDNVEQQVAPKERVAAVSLVKAKEILPSNAPPNLQTTTRTEPTMSTVPPVKPKRIVSNSTAAETTTPGSRRTSVAALPPIKPKRDFSNNAPPMVQAPDEPLRHTSIETPARRSVSGKPVTPAKSPDLSTLKSKSPSPEVPRKPASTGLEKTSFFKDPRQQSPAVEQAPEPVPPKAGPFRASRPLPTPPTAEEKRPAPQSEKREAEVAGFSVKNVSALWGKQASSPPSTRTKSPIKLPTRADEREAMANAGLVQPTAPAAATRTEAPVSKPVGLGLGSFGGYFTGRAARESSPPKPISTSAFPASPPASAGRPQSEPFALATRTVSPVSKPVATKPANVFAEYFDEPPVITGELPKEIDTLQILTSSPLELGPSSKIRTLRKQIQEITGDGKLTPVPIHEEHVLFQESMYLCTHVFGDAKGARHTEVYLWAGNGVPDPELEDTQVFSRNIAKQNQGKLVVLRQGKETPNFCEALGGIVITRRGARPASKQYMLCGRRHLGHLTFDEVDFSLNSLCSGFPYIAVTENSKAFLWKGRGCSAEELSGARLMGMDLTATGELIEMDEDEEISEFFEIFPIDVTNANPQSPGRPIPRSADYWRYKASIEKFRTRLFRIEQHPGPSAGWGQSLQSPPTSMPTPKSPAPGPQITTRVVEVVPFCQKDLEPDFIYVCDAFFEIYIIVGPETRTQSLAFSTALLFAQEYSLLAVGEDNRPMVAATTVVLDGTPRDMKAAFRHWDDEKIPAAGLIRGKLGRGKSLRLVKLEKAIEATRRSAV